MRLNRREFMLATAAIPAGAAVAGELFIQPDDRALLLALGRRILPAELGESGLRRAVEGFERWVSTYRPGAEVNHGYGTGRIEYLPPDPWPRWRGQLRALTPEQIRNIDQLPDLTRAERLPAPLAAPHVTLALLAWFYDTPEANDLCYQARIARESCRPLNAVRAKP